MGAKKSGKAVWEKGLVSEACGGFGDCHSNLRTRIIKSVLNLLLFSALRIKPGIQHVLCIFFSNERISFRIHTESIPLGLNTCFALKMSVNVRAKCLEFIKLRIFDQGVNDKIISGEVSSVNRM